MKKILCLISVLLVLACANDDDVDVEIALSDPPKNKIILLINGTEFSENIVNSSAFYSCNESLSISFSSKKNGVTSELLSIVLTKDGQIKYAHFVDKSFNYNKTYRTADFFPSTTLNIEEFEFKEEETLMFKINGTLLEETDNYLKTPKELQINAQIEINEFGKSICSYNKDFIRLNDNIYFTDISKISQNTSTNPSVRYNSNSLNGFNISFKNFNTSFKDIPIGSYNFNTNSVKEKIEFRKYIGIPKAFSTYIYLPSDWRLYESSGNFSIEEKVIIDNKMVIKGKINFSAFYNDTLEYNFKDADFQIIE
jgi:hypothetical protein